MVDVPTVVVPDAKLPLEAASVEEEPSQIIAGVAVAETILGGVPTTTTTCEVTEQPKLAEKQHIVTQIKPDLEKIKLESENIKLKSTEKKNVEGKLC